MSQPKQQVAGVGVDRAQEALRAGVVEFMLDRMAGQRGMVGFDVHLHVIAQPVGAEEVDAGGRVEIVLVLGRLLGLRLEIELAGEADLLGVIDGHVHEGGQMLDLALHVGVPQALIALASAPERVALPAEFLRHFEGLLHLGRGEGEGVGVAACGGAVHVTRIAEQVGRAPEQLDAGPLLLLLEHFDDRVEVLVRFGQRRAFRGDVAVVEAIERSAELLDELEADADAVDGVLDRVGRALPRAAAWCPAQTDRRRVPRIVCQ